MKMAFPMQTLQVLPVAIEDLSTVGRLKCIIHLSHIWGHLSRWHGEQQDSAWSFGRDCGATP